MNIFLELRGKNGKPLKAKVESFELTLSNTSTEPGITINYPIEPDGKQLPDLRFLLYPGIESIDEDQFISIGSPDGVKGKAMIASYDGGGWATLSVEAILTDKRRIKGHLFKSAGDIDILIPKRVPGTKIALAWSKKYGNPGDMDDKETSKGNTHNGDGFTAYEEYRGIICGMEFRNSNPNRFGRLDPTKKEVGILATKMDFSLFDEGIGWFKNASGLEIIHFDFDKNEVAPDGKINMNKKTAHDYDQYALYLLNGALRGPLGVTYTKTKTPNIPSQIIGVAIDWNAIQSAYADRINDARPATPKFTLKEYLAQTVAHELGHSVNIWHHGNDIRLDKYDDKLKEYVPFVVHQVTNGNRIFDRQGNLITTRPYTIWFIGGESGTVESGDLSCMLNYYPYYNWGHTKGADGADIFNQEPLLPLGKIFCKSPAGTNFNTTQLYFAKAAATKGNCLSQIQLRN